jgi:hypothetical protein
MGYATESKAYRVWDLTKDKIVITRDVLFHETSQLSAPSSSLPVSPTPSTVTILSYLSNLLVH